MKSRSLQRKISHKWLSGVCAGLAEYFSTEVIVFRIAFVVTALFSGLGIAVYLILLVVIPPENIEKYEPAERELMLENDYKSITGTLLVISGIYYVITTSSLIISFGYLHDLFSKINIWFIILLGVILFRQKTVHRISENNPQRLRKSVVDKKITGVCGGLANYLSTNSTIVRMIWIFSVFATLGITLILYLVLSFYLPKNERVRIIEE